MSLADLLYYWENNLPPKEDLECSGRFIYEDEEGYMIEQTITFLKKILKLHDFKKQPHLPKCLMAQHRYCRKSQYGYCTATDLEQSQCPYLQAISEIARLAIGGLNEN